MSQTVEALFDGEVFRPTHPIELQADTQVELVVTVKSPPVVNDQSFLSVASSLRLTGPIDWSSRLDDYLYGGAKLGDE